MPSLPFSGSAGRTKDVVKYKIFPSLNLCTLARKGSGGGRIKSGKNGKKGRRKRWKEGKGKGGEDGVGEWEEREKEEEEGEKGRDRNMGRKKRGRGGMKEMTC